MDARDGGARYNTTLSFTSAQPGAILGWLDSDGELAGVLGRTTYESSPAWLTPGTIPPPGAPSSR